MQLFLILTLIDRVYIKYRYIYKLKLKNIYDNIIIKIIKSLIL